MILRVLTLCCSLVLIPAKPLKYQRCLTGYMTDVQDWVDEVGVLTPGPHEIEYAVDLSSNMFPVPMLQQTLSQITFSPRSYIKYLSLARCHLNRVPPIFVLRDTKHRGLSETLEYVSFYGNSFLGINSAEQYEMSFNATDTIDMNLADGFQFEVTNIWSTGLTLVTFPRLKELDLRACSIQTLGENLFTGMPSLRALYLGENEISFIDSTAFFGLHNLRHLDFSRNRAYDDDGKPKNLASDAYFILRDLTSLVSLDLSFTRMTQRNLGMICRLHKSFKSLSLCETGLTSLIDGIFNTTSLEILDLSGNSGILTFHNVLRGIENSLKVLNARDVGLHTMDIFQNFTKLEILQLSHNEIGTVRERVIRTLRSLKILDLNNNRLPAWFESTFSAVPTLKLLSLRNNNINIISEEMIQDVINVEYLALSGNFIVCNCHAKDLYKMAFKNQRTFQTKLIKVPKHQMYHNGYTFYNQIIRSRQNMDLDCDERCLSDIGETGRFRLVDYNPSSYICLKIPESRSVAISSVTSCRKAKRDMDYETELANGRLVLLSLLIIPAVLVPVAILFILRRQIRYCFITMRNSATLSLINKNETIVDGTVFNYDVFVSYCNEDRGWVLDHLLPHMEAECSISACLHERDFQVGLSILENIVSCMDRSRSIMLIISQRFLLSQWCQFEMHLAQHRLLETRREDLTLVLLEEIPRRLRPNTLHYLMLTKTYIVWPKDESERNVFWRRLNKTLISQKTKQTENVSLA